MVLKFVWFVNDFFAKLQLIINKKSFKNWFYEKKNNLQKFFTTKFS